MSVSSCFSISIVESPELNRLISLAFSEERDIRLCVANNLSLLLTPPTSEYRGIRGAIFSLSLSRDLSIYLLHAYLTPCVWLGAVRARSDDAEVRRPDALGAVAIGVRTGGGGQSGGQQR